MSGVRLIGLIVLALGILALAYGGFSYTKKTHEADLGPLQIQVQDKEHVNIPVWAGVAAAAVGAGMLAFGGRRVAS